MNKTVHDGRGNGEPTAAARDAKSAHATAPSHNTNRHPLTGWIPLLQATLKFDGKRFAPWVAIATLLTVSSVIAYPLVFPNEADRAELATVIGANPAMGLIFGPAYDLSTIDGFNAWRSLALGGFLTAIGAIFAVTRAVREQEDTGQAELLASSVLGRESRLLVGVLVAVIGSLAAGIASGVIAALCGGSWEASLLVGATFTVTGWLFAGVAAITSQLASEAKTANSLAMITLGVLFVMRGFLYSMNSPDWAKNINPLSWILESKPAVDNNWGMLLPAVGLALLFVIVGFVLQTRRDFGQGIIPTSPGHPRGRMGSPWALAVRLNRNTLITWLCASALIGCVFGYFAGSFKDILADNPAMAHFFASGQVSPDDLVGGFATTILAMTGIILSVPGVLIALGMHAEESRERLEPVIVAYGSRVKYFLSNVALSFAASLVFMLVAGSMMALIMSNSDIGLSFGDVLAQALLTVPALWAIAGVAAAVVGARPHVIIAAWAGVFLSFGLTILGPTFNLWDWIISISPFEHVPQVLGGDPSWVGICVVGVIALVLVAVGTAGFRRRDLSK